MKTVSSWFAIAAVAMAPLGATAAQAPDGAIERAVAAWAKVKTVRGTFEQTVTNAQRRSSQASSGTFAFARPGKFRWSYVKPFAQLIVGDGSRVWVYDQDLNQVTVRELDAALGATPAALLAGDNALQKSFNLAEGRAANGLEYVDATPKAADSQFRHIRIGFRDDLPRAMILDDAFGQTTELRFTTIERNPQLAPDLFQFTPPKGADVVGQPK
jgi:outer membrane lipoprotein carrier protein